MTQDEIIRMARDAGLPEAWIAVSGVLKWSDLERFAALVAEAKDEEIASLNQRLFEMQNAAIELSKLQQQGMSWTELIEAMRIETLEKAAKVCEAIRIERIKSEWDAGHETGCSSCAAAIRSMK
jgi:hypothetical protein